MAASPIGMFAFMHKPMIALPLSPSSSMSGWWRRAMTRGNDDATRQDAAPDDIPSFYRVREDGWLIFSLRTADRNEWVVRVEPDALAGMADQECVDHDAIRRIMMHKAAHLELAALRMIAKGDVDGDTVTLTVADFRR
jgi:hypothetical protein